MAVGYATLTAAQDPQTVATALEAQTNINSAEALGDFTENGLLVPSATAAINNLSDIAAGDTTIEYDTLVGELPTDLPFKIQIDSEIMRCTSWTSTVLTVVRGIDGTVDAAHLDNAVITVPGDVMSNSAMVVFRIDGVAAVDVTNAIAAVSGVEAASGYPAAV